jgi:hypothetical protein
MRDEVGVAGTYTGGYGHSVCGEADGVSVRRRFKFRQLPGVIIHVTLHLAGYTGVRTTLCTACVGVTIFLPYPQIRN